MQRGLLSRLCPARAPLQGKQRRAGGSAHSSLVSSFQICRQEERMLGCTGEQGRQGLRLTAAVQPDLGLWLTQRGYTPAHPGLGLTAFPPRLGLCPLVLTLDKGTEPCCTCNPSRPTARLTLFLSFLNMYAHFLISFLLLLSGLSHCCFFHQTSLSGTIRSAY